MHGYKSDIWLSLVVYLVWQFAYQNNKDFLNFCVMSKRSVVYESVRRGKFKSKSNWGEKTTYPITVTTDNGLQHLHYSFTGTVSEIYEFWITVTNYNSILSSGTERYKLLSKTNLITSQICKRRNLYKLRVNNFPLVIFVIKLNETKPNKPGISHPREVQGKTPKKWKFEAHPSNYSFGRYTHVHTSNWSFF